MDSDDEFTYLTPEEWAARHAAADPAARAAAAARFEARVHACKPECLGFDVFYKNEPPDEQVTIAPCLDCDFGPEPLTEAEAALLPSVPDVVAGVRTFLTMQRDGRWPT